MSFTQAKENTWSFSEVTENDNQVLITNSSGRAYDDYEIVKESGYVGEVREYGGIANGATGRINICHERTVKTAQITVTDTFVVGRPVYFLPGGSGAAGKIRATPVAGSVQIGICLEEGGTGGAQTYVVYRPYDQGLEAKLGQILKVKEIVVPTGSHGAGAPVVNTDIPVGSKIVDIKTRATVTNASGTVTVSDGTNAITNAMVMAVINTMVAAGTIDTTYATVIAAGLKLTANATGDAGIVYVYYI